jgi:hypothetical protein
MYPFSDLAMCVAREVKIHPTKNGTMNSSGKKRNVE